MSSRQIQTASFASGQRWVSNSEPELGLGLVEDNDGRRVTLFFPAAEESRTYAIDNAPLSRVAYSVGEHISTADGVSFEVTSRAEHNGCLFYFGVDADGDELVAPETQLTSAVQFSKPQDRLFAGQIDSNAAFELRVDTLAYRQRHRSSPVFGLLGARVQLLPHQLYIAHRVAQRHAPRVLLADEVGLGKTIEAGLIVHQQLLSDRIGRVLILVPDALVHQWLVEMLRRFNLPFSLFDEERCAGLEATDEINPFETSQLVLCGLSLLTASEVRAQQCLDAQWDMLVVDEAHHLHWDESGASLEYQTVEALSQRTAGLLLLTATPEQLGLEGHFARLRLVDPDRYHDLEQFKSEEAHYEPLAALLESLATNDENLDKAVQTANQVLHPQLARDLSDLIQQRDSAKPTHELIDRILDQHGTGRVLFRNTRDAIGGFSTRSLHRYPLGSDDIGSHTLLSEQRLEWLTGWMRQHRSDKVLLITHDASVAQDLEKTLRLQGGFRTAVFHEHMTLIARDRAAAYFAETDDGAQILVCSEIGSEGRNFQFAHHLILFDLPPNPDLLEQRIGRLDRIGQRETVQIHVPYVPGSDEEVRLRWYDEGINAFESPFLGGDRLMIAVGELLGQATTKTDGQLENLIETTRTASEGIRDSLARGRNRLLEFNSCHPSRAAHVVSLVADAAHNLDLGDYMERVFDRFGIDHQAHSANSIVLHPTDHMLSESFPGLPDDGMTATYSRSQALAREDVHFLTWEHPMVTGVMDQITFGEFGNTAVCTLKLSGLAPGTLLLETFYLLHSVAPLQYNIERYTPQALLRLVVDERGRDFSEAMAANRVNQLVERVPGRTAEELVRRARSEIEKVAKNSMQIAQGRRDELVDSALSQLHELRSAEQARLDYLSSVNPNIRTSELEFYRESTAKLEGFVQTADLRLDAIRVIVSV